jgi:hypothetical protein
VSSFTCISNRCCLQFASELQAGITFQAINWLLFKYPGAKGNPLGSKCNKTDIHSNEEYEASARFMHARQLLTTSCGIIARQCIIDIYMSKRDYIIVWRCVLYRQIVTSELVWLVCALTLEHVT